MATNPWVSQNVRSEQNLYEDLVIESLKFYGQDVYYLPRELVNTDAVFRDDVVSRFSDAYKIEMYVENTDGFSGEGDLFTKFGIELRDQATFVVARRRWKSLIGNKLDELNFRPREGDLIYIPFSKSLFEIFKVETETPFYQLNQLPTFRITCELFEYNDEDFDTEIADIDDEIEQNLAYQYKLSMRSQLSSTATATATINDLGQVTRIDAQDAGFGYLTAPTITVQTNPGDNFKFGNSSLNVTIGRGLEGSYTQQNVHGSVEMFVYVSQLPSAGTQQVLFITGGNDDDDAIKRWIWGINEEGKLVYSRVGSSTQTNTFTDGSLIFNTGTWHHLLLVAHSTNTLKIYFDGENVFDSTITGIEWDWISSSRYVLGSSAARTVGQVQWDAFLGYVDEFRALVGGEDVTVTPRLDGAGPNIVVPTQAFTSDSNTAALQHFDAETATATATINNNGRIESIEVGNSGIYYNTEPEVTISAPHSSLNYERGEIVTQTNADYTIKGEVGKWEDSGDTLYLVHVGSTDGKLHTFGTYNAIVGENSGASWSAELVEELQNIQESAQNVTVFDNFESDLGDFVDFSESNPFGDMQ